MRRWPSAVRALAFGSALVTIGCATPRRPPTVPPARIEMERLAQRHFLHGQVSPAERARLARLLDLHGRGAEAALLEAPDDPARAERAWFAGSRAVPFVTADVARARLPIATARYADDPRAIRTLWLLAHAAQLDRHFLAGLAARWRADWPASDEARLAQTMSQPPAPAPAAVDLDAWTREHPLDLPGIRAADARWRAPADLAGQARWAAVRVLAVWRAGAFDVRTAFVPQHGPVIERRHRAAHVSTATDRVVRRLDVRVWGPSVEPRDGAPTPIAAADGWTASATGIPARRIDTWAASEGPRWIQGDRPLTPRHARLHWRLWPHGQGWRGTLSGDGLAPDFARLLALEPDLSVGAVRPRPMQGGHPGWRATVRFDGPPTRSLLDDAHVEALGGPIAMGTLANAPPRLEDLRLAPASVDIRLTTPEALPIAPRTLDQQGWQQTIGPVGDATIRRSWRRPGVDCTAGRFDHWRAVAQAAQADLAALAPATVSPSLRRLIGAPAPDLED